MVNLNDWDLTEADNPFADVSSDADDLWLIMLHLSWVSRRQFSHELEAANLTVPQYMALLTLHRRSGDCTMQALAEATHQVPATITGIVDRLAECSLVERRRNPDDRRSWHVALTAAGNALLDRLNAQKRVRLVAALAKLAPEERREMLRLLKRYLALTLAEDGAAQPENQSFRSPEDEK